MACFTCKTNGARVCGGSCGLCGEYCPGYEPEKTVNEYTNNVDQ